MAGCAASRRRYFRTLTGPRAVMETRSSSPRATVLFLGAALLVSMLPGCDGSASDIDAGFFVGTWGLVGVHDGSGDRTSDVFALVESLRVTFVATGSFDLLIQYTEAADHPDRSITGTYAVSQSGQLILTAVDTAMSFQVTLVSDNRIELRAPAVLVQNVIAGTEIDIAFSGTVALTLDRV